MLVFLCNCFLHFIRPNDAVSRMKAVLWDLVEIRIPAVAQANAEYNVDLHGDSVHEKGIHMKN
jgi:hypothetical protein